MVLTMTIKDGIKYEVIPFMTEVPSLHLKVGEAMLLMLYREWNKDRVPGAWRIILSKSEEVSLNQPQWRNHQGILRKKLTSCLNTKYLEKVDWTRSLRNTP